MTQETTTLLDVRMPDLGEGLTESEVVAWTVAVGDTVTLNQVIAEVETAKALVQLPSPHAGVVEALLVEPGTTVDVGATIARIAVPSSQGAPPAPDGEEGHGGPSAGTTAEAAPDDGAGAAPEGSGSTADDAAPTGRTSVLVGYGPPVEGGRRPRRRPRAASWVAAHAGTADRVPAQPHAPTSDGTTSAAERPRTYPPVRKLAHDLGVDLRTVTGTGPDGLITREDVLRSGQAPADVDAGSREVGTPREPVGPGAAPSDLPARELRIPVSGVRRRTAEAMVASAFTAPHATEFLTVDVTPSTELLATLAGDRAFRDRRLTILTLAAKAVLVAVRRTPEVNARWDEDAGEIVQYGYVDLGIAAATPRGLLVPVIRDADRLDLGGLADALSELTSTAREGRTPPADLTGGTLSITNIGVFGIDAGTPILNPGEAAILAVGAVRRLPWEHRGEVALRDVMTLSVSFDHRVVDGAQASRFLADVGTVLAHPERLVALV